MTEVRPERFFEILVREHHHRVLAFAMALGADREAARDLVQDAFLIAYRRIDDFDLSRDFGAWVRGIVRNKYLQWAARRQETPMDPAIINEIDLLHTGWDHAAASKEAVFAQLRECVSELPEAMRQAVHDFYFERQSCKAIAKTAQAEVVTVRKRLQRARQQLGECLRRGLAEVDS